MHRAGILVLIALSSLYACTDTVPQETEAQRQLPMLGANVESGWPGVGALTFQYPGYGYQGSFCSGALIAPQWVLTAAHCLVSHDDFELSPEIVQFYSGTNANPTGSWGGWPSGGEFHQADAFFIHPDYNPNDTVAKDDIGLLHLSEPVYDSTIYPYNASVLTGSVVGDEVFYVGYGATEGINSTGGGVKRSGYVEISYVDETEYYSEYEGIGVCFGDSGGPGFLEIGGETRIIGVNSRVGGEDGGDPCQGTSAHTRVDHYAIWIASLLDAPPLNCNSQPDICYCADACNGNGTCNNDACKTKDCEAIYTCLGDCGEDSGCAADCYITGTDAGKEELDELFKCYADFCEGVPDDEWGECVGTNCNDPIETCLPIGTGPLSCEEVYTCFNDCAQGDNVCTFDCYEQGTSAAQGQVDQLNTCFETYCSDTATDSAWYQCINANCAAQITACWPPANCDVSGGDCEAGMACYPSTGDSTDCFTSDGGAIGSACNNDASDNLPCVDGGLCMGGGGTSVCTPMCEASSDCGEGDYCYIPIFQDVDDIGICLCIDEDSDTWCQTADCNDLNAGINPGQAEACDDGYDNDCDGQIDEGCGTSCTDADGDGSCAADDCDDTDQLSHPGAEELCGDGRDNDCDGTVDDGCPDGCPDGDNDGDGACLDMDCNDNSAAIYPGAPEACGDGLDNDCDGSTDEGCEGCVDADNDGYCLGSTDCDDTDPQVNPTATEICGDGRDQDCDGVDTPCTTPGDGDGDGYFATVDCDDTNPARYPGAAESCGDGTDGDCDGLIDEGCPGVPNTGVTGTGEGNTGNASLSGGCTSGGEGPSTWLGLLFCVWALRQRRAAVA